MNVVELLLVADLVAVSTLASISDLKYGYISNKLIVIGLVIGVILDAVYYIFFQRPLAAGFGINLAVVACISVLLYGFHVWSAGDSKLSILLAALIPANIYSNAATSVAPCIVIFIFTFSIGFIYAVAESVVLGIRRKDLFSFSGLHFNYKDLIFRFASVSSLLFLLSVSAAMIFPDFCENNRLLILFGNLIIVLLIQDWKWLANPFAACGLVLLGIATAIITKTHYVVSWYVYFIVAGLILLRTFAEKYNYETIKTEDLKAGMILSLGTVMRFKTSKVDGLPFFSTEDLRSRLSQEEVQAILRWKDSRGGADSLVIVRKLPFAIIISGSTIVFVIMEVLLK